MGLMLWHHPASAWAQMAAGVAYLYSLATLLRATVLGGTTPHVYFETAAMILAFIATGKLLEARARDSAAAAIRELMWLQPREATRIEEGRLQSIATDDVGPGDPLLVRPGERVLSGGPDLLELR